MYNMGTNIIFGEISYITKALAAVLQLAVTMDYSIFLYNSYEERQQETDNLRVFKASAILTPVVSNNYGSNSMLSNTYEISLPDDYLHILNCVVEYTLLKNFNCKIIGETMSFGAKRLTADA